MKSRPPWSRLLCTQPERADRLARSRGAELAAGVGAIGVHGVSLRESAGDKTPGLAVSSQVW